MLDRPAQVVCRAVVAAEGEGGVGAGETCRGAGGREHIQSGILHVISRVNITVLEKDHKFYKPFYKLTTNKNTNNPK